jgi:sugar phosphate isomerase/epimerase
MYINLDPEAVGIDLPLEELTPLAARHGYEGIDLPLSRIGEGRETLSLEQIEEAMASAGLKFGSFGAPWDYAGERAVYEQRMDELSRWLPIARRLGCDRGVSGARPCSDDLEYAANFQLHVERLAPMARLMADHGIRFGLEFIWPKTLRDGMKYEFVHTLPQMLDLAAAIAPAGGEQYVGVLLDSYHWYTSGGTEEELTRLLDNRKTVLVHINDGVEGRGRDQQMDLERRLPCATGIIDAAGFVRCLEAIGYDGPVTVEPFDAELEKQEPEETAKQVIASARRMLAMGES